MILLSDLLGAEESSLRGIDTLRRAGHDVMVLHILDDDELDFPFADPTRFEGLESDDHLTCNPRALREGYLEALERFLDRVRRSLCSFQERLSADSHQRCARRGAVQDPQRSPCTRYGDNWPMQFLFQPLTWGFLLVAVPILIHLINLLRHRKQKWAAMDFLARELSSQSTLGHAQAMAAAGRAHVGHAVAGGHVGQVGQQLSMAGDARWSSHASLPAARR